MLVRCTARLRKLLAPADLIDRPHAGSDWYANLIWIDRRKCVLLVHADTLFSAFIADVRKPALMRFGRFVTEATAAELDDEDLPCDVLGRLDPDEVSSARRRAVASSAS